VNVEGLPGGTASPALSASWPRPKRPLPGDRLPPAREGQSPFPPQPSAGSPRPNPSPGRRRPDRQSQRGFRVPLTRTWDRGRGCSPHRGLGSHGPRGGTRTENNRGIVQQYQTPGRNSPACPLGAIGPEALSPRRCGVCWVGRGAESRLKTPPKWRESRGQHGRRRLSPSVAPSAGVRVPDEAGLTPPALRPYVDRRNMWLRTERGQTAPPNSRSSFGGC